MPKRCVYQLQMALRRCGIPSERPATYKAHRGLPTSCTHCHRSAPSRHTTHEGAWADGRCGAACVTAKGHPQPSTFAGSRARSRPRAAPTAPPPQASVRSRDTSAAQVPVSTPGHRGSGGCWPCALEIEDQRCAAAALVPSQQTLRLPNTHLKYCCADSVVRQPANTSVRNSDPLRIPLAHLHPAQSVASDSWYEDGSDTLACRATT